MSVGDNVSQDEMSGGQLFLGQNVWRTIYRGSCGTASQRNAWRPFKLTLVQKSGHSFCSVSSGTNSTDDVVIVPSISAMWTA